MQKGVQNFGIRFPDKFARESEKSQSHPASFCLILFLVARGYCKGRCNVQCLFYAIFVPELIRQYKHDSMNPNCYKLELDLHLLNKLCSGFQIHCLFLCVCLS